MSLMVHYIWVLLRFPSYLTYFPAECCLKELIAQQIARNVITIPLSQVSLRAVLKHRRTPRLETFMSPWTSTLTLTDKTMQGPCFRVGLMIQLSQMDDGALKNQRLSSENSLI
jgi:hypothetical protein